MPKTYEYTFPHGAKATFPDERTQPVADLIRQAATKCNGTIVDDDFDGDEQLIAICFPEILDECRFVVATGCLPIGVLLSIH